VKEPLPTCTEQQERVLLDTFNALRDELCSSLYFLLNSHADAQDALQVAFLHCWKARAKLSDIANLRAWIWRVCLNAGRDLRDRAWRRRTRPLSTVEGAACPRQRLPAENLIDEEERERLRTALIRLRPEEKEVFLLRQNGNLTFEEIAQLRRSPVASGKTLMRSAIRKLTRIIQEEDDPPQRWNGPRLRRSSSLLGAAQ
jgi:RNA polymerase sigma-70 factor (ECF subfamily)